MIPEKSRVAVIGAGVAGLTAAYLLQQRHEVTLYEKNGYFGGHTNTIAIPDGPDAGLAVDTGFIVFNDRNYPTFRRLLGSLDLDGQPSDMSFGFSSEENRLEYSSYVPRGLLAQPWNLLRPSFLRMIRDILRFNRQATEDLTLNRLGSKTMGAYLEEGKYCSAFRDCYLIPMGAAIWSTPLEQMLDFPASTFARFFFNHGLLALKGRPCWMTVPGGSWTYVKAITACFRGRLESGAAIAAVKRSRDGVSVRLQNGREECFDYAVIGAHADEALRLLEDPSPEEKRYLGAWTYTRNHTVLHTDASVMPSASAAWASWNYRVERPHDPKSPVTLSYHMNRLQSLRSQKQYFVTLNRARPFAPGSVIREIEYMHPMYTPASLHSQEFLPSLNGPLRTYYCGSYFGYGFHEDAVKSAVAAVKPFGVELRS